MRDDIDDDIDELKKLLERTNRINSLLREEIYVKEKTIQLLVVAGLLDSDRLDQAIALATKG